ncbi:tRNA (adenine(58)-n(1))-methyltransferase non-catalytic subunit trm6 [Plakobranchus ocellatus]|uniref:tRNA (adenine(58)-N(1))-methyltransferase non-catalytic subunit TRM6 n=2 Tax=Plakobranchus ocellatus TaxID=259542 RepID=A0AAV4CAC9_9GAST|nr:tRNA (adenine(58)-n(1))-methyltransferase non-catalytic subunit trm6 [Plakobranchus ocellatus]
MEPQLINEGDQVVFHREGWSRVFQIRKKRQVYLDKTKLDVDSLIGQPYGSTFEVDRGKLVKIEKDASQALSICESSSSPGTDNRNLLDLDSNQRMSKEDIMKMKDEGITGQKIIEELIENSETFKKKTEFSQAKYLKKKTKKHIPVFTVMRPTPRLILEIFSKDPSKICYLRADSLSQLLSYSNVMHGSKVALVETCQGLVLSCLLQRCGDAGKIVQLIPNSTNAICRQVMDYLGFGKFKENVYTFPLDELSSLNDASCSSNARTEVSQTKATEPCNVRPAAAPVEGEQNVTEGSEPDAQTEETADPDSNSSPYVEEQDRNEAAEDDNIKAEEPRGEEDVVMDDTKAERDAKTGDKRSLGPNREAQRQRREARQQEAGVIIKEKQFDSLVIACKYNPMPILLKMLEFMRPSSSVVVYCQYLEPLVECYTSVKENHAGLQLKLSETWFREYQILPQRTHPKINMSGTGGFLLTFITSQRSTDSKKL